MKTLFRSIDVAAATMVALALMAPHLGAWEGRAFPVASLDVTAVEVTADGHTRVTGIIRKLRDCRVVGLDWWQGEPHRSAYAATRSEGAVVDLTGGASAPFGPFVVLLNMTQFERSSATVRHECHGLWETETTAWRGNT